MKIVRVWFQKLGAARYISHLDLNRCMARAIHRARIPLWYTEGFNPHAFITFALPLSLGVAGERESMDMKVDETKITNGEIACLLNAALPPDLPVLEVTEPVMKPGKIALASYVMRYESEGVSVEELKAQFDRLLDMQQIPVIKKTKSGEKEFDLKPSLDGLKASVDGDAVIVDLVLPAGGDLNVNPALLGAALERHCGVSTNCFTRRTNLFDQSGSPFA